MVPPPAAPEQPRPPLPAVYEDPWRRLAGDLVAVVAAAALKARELWRLNGEGSLARPGFWPRSLAPLFWPSLLGLLLALLLALVVGLGPRLSGWWGQLPGETPDGLQGAVPSDVRQVDPAQGDPSPADRSGAEGWGDGDRIPDAGALAERGGALRGPAPALGASDLGASADGAPSRGLQADGPEGDQADTQARRPGRTGRPAGADSGPTDPEITATEPAAGSGAFPNPPRTDDTALPAIPPLALSDLVGPEPPAWVGELEVRPAEGLLRLRVGEAYSNRPLAERRSLAEHWLERSRELGYERLELVDPQGRLLVRPARVGSGMILLDVASSSP